MVAEEGQTESETTYASDVNENIMIDGDIIEYDDIHQDELASYVERSNELEPIKDWEAFKESVKKFVSAFSRPNDNAAKSDDPVEPLLKLESENLETEDFHFLSEGTRIYQEVSEGESESEAEECESTNSHNKTNLDSKTDVSKIDNDSQVSEASDEEIQPLDERDYFNISLLQAFRVIETQEYNTAMLDISFKYFANTESSVRAYFDFLKTESKDIEARITELSRVLVHSRFDEILLFIFKQLQQLENSFLTRYKIEKIEKIMDGSQPFTPPALFVEFLSGYDSDIILLWRNLGKSVFEMVSTNNLSETEFSNLTELFAKFLLVGVIDDLSNTYLHKLKVVSKIVELATIFSNIEMEQLINM